MRPQTGRDSIMTASTARPSTARTILGGNTTRRTMGFSAKASKMNID
jgi:hypothetical protein